VLCSLLSIAGLVLMLLLLLRFCSVQTASCLKKKVVQMLRRLLQRASTRSLPTQLHLIDVPSCSSVARPLNLTPRTALVVLAENNRWPRKLNLLFFWLWPCTQHPPLLNG
jgi:hypothetical protein